MCVGGDGENRKKRELRDRGGQRRKEQEDEGEARLPGLDWDEDS